MSAHTPVIHLVVPRINRALEQLLDLLLAHLLAQVGEYVLDLALSDEAGAVLVEDLEAADVFFDVEGFAEAAGAVEDFAEGFKVDWRGSAAVRGRAGGVRTERWGRKRRVELTVCADTTLQIANLGERGVLPAGAQQVAQGALFDAAVAALVEELEGFAVVGGGLVVVIHCCSLRCVVMRERVAERWTECGCDGGCGRGEGCCDTARAVFVAPRCRGARDGLGKSDAATPAARRRNVGGATCDCLDCAGSGS